MLLLVFQMVKKGTGDSLNFSNALEEIGNTQCVRQELHDHQRQSQEKHDKHMYIYIIICICIYIYIIYMDVLLFAGNSRGIGHASQC